MWVVYVLRPILSITDSEAHFIQCRVHLGGDDVYEDSPSPPLR